MTKTIRFNAFEMNCVGHQSPGLWRHPRDRSWQYKDLEYWTDLAKLLETGFFDSIFIADVIGYYDVYKGNLDNALLQGVQIPVNDPLQLANPIALATNHLGIGITASTSFEHPYTFARRLSTADHHTKGRIGWNIVTSYLESGAKNVGQGGLRSHDNRYDVASEYLEVVYKLFEGSWEEGAVVRDKERGIFADPTKIHEVGHKGKYFDVPGYHLCEPSPQRTPVLFQAGASNAGKDVAAGHAECVFISTPLKDATRAYVADIRQRAAAQGRDPKKLLVYAMATIIVDETDAKARAKYEEYVKYASYDGALVLMSGWTGIDFGHYKPADTVQQRSHRRRTPVRRPEDLDDRGAGTVGWYWRHGAALCRLALYDRRYPAGMGRGYRHRRVQPRLCTGARNLRRRDRLCGAGTSEARRLCHRLSRRNAA